MPCAWITFACCVVGAVPPGPLRAAPLITALAISPDGRTVAVGSQKGIDVRRLPGLGLLRSLPTDLVHVHDLAFSPDGRRLAATGGAPAEEGAIEVYSWPEGEILLRRRLHGDVVYSLAWRDDSKVLATASLDHTARLLDAATGRVQQTLRGHSRGITSVVFLPGGKTLVTAGLDHSLRVWDAATGASIRTLDNHTAPVTDLALRPGRPAGPACRAGPSGASSAAASGPVRQTGRIKVAGTLRVPSAAAVSSLWAAGALGGGIIADGERSVPAASIRREALPMIVSTSRDGTVRLWQPTIGRLVRFARLKPAVPLSAAWTPDGKLIVVSCSDGRCRVIDPDTVQVVAEHDAVDDRAWSLDIAPTGRAVVGGRSGRLKVVRLAAE